LRLNVCISLLWVWFKCVVIPGSQRSRVVIKLIGRITLKEDGSCHTWRCDNKLLVGRYPSEAKRWIRNERCMCGGTNQFRIIVTRFLSKNLNNNKYKTVILSLVLCGYETWSRTLR
jgi:hypothetical protein